MPVVCSWHGAGKTYPFAPCSPVRTGGYSLLLDNAAPVSVHFSHARKPSLLPLRIERREGSAKFFSIDDRGYKLCLAKRV